MPNLSRIKSTLKKILGKDRYAHSLRVMQAAERLAKRYKVSLQKARLAGLLHDCSRSGVSPRQFIALAKTLGMKISVLEKQQPKLLHAPLSAKIAQRDFGIKDKAILRAIALHTLGSARMSLLDKIIYLADHIEEGRNYPEVKHVRKTAFCDMDQAIVLSTSAMIKSLTEKKMPVARQTILTRKAHMGKQRGYG